MEDSLGDRMKAYEKVESKRQLAPSLPIIARMDGRGFSKFTRGLDKPFDATFVRCMLNTTRSLVDMTGATIGYTQSDEITLVWDNKDENSQTWFNKRVQKMVSQLAAQTTILFYRELLDKLPGYSDRYPTFDARVWNVPDRGEVVNALLWREQDAEKNSVSMAASSVYSHKELLDISSSGRKRLLDAKGINWYAYPAHFKYGTYVRRLTEMSKFTSSELSKLPPKHMAHLNPDLEIMRSVVKTLNSTIPLGRMCNKMAVVFEGADPL